MLAMLDELNLLELKNALYAERPGVNRSHCEPGKPLVEIGDPRDVRAVQIDMGCPEHIEAGKRLVAAMAELAGATDEIGEWPEEVTQER